MTRSTKGRSAEPAGHLGQQGEGADHAATGVALMFDALIHEHGRFIVSYLRSRNVDHQDIDDVLQNILMAVYTSLDKYDRERGSVRDWLAGIVRRQLSLRRRPAYLRYEDPDADVSILEDDVPSSEQRLCFRDEDRILEEILDKVPPQRRAIIVSHALDGLAMEEIARSRSTPLGTTRTAYRLGMQDARREARRWQARQLRRRLPGLPWLVVPFLATKRAWAAATRPARVTALAGLALLALAGCAAVLLFVHATPALVATPATPPALVLPIDLSRPTPSTTPAIVAPVVPIAPATRSPPPRRPLSPGVTPSPDRPAHDWILLTEAHAAYRAGKYGHATRLFEQHAALFPASANARERDAYRLALGETVRSRDRATTTR